MSARARGSFAADPQRGAPETVAQAQVAVPLVVLLRDAAVRRELRLTSLQATAIDKVLADVDYPLWWVRDLKDDETQVKCARAFEHLQKNLESTLQESQRQRVDGLLLQFHGWASLLIPKFAEKLAITSDQQVRLRELLKPTEDKMAASSGTLTADQQQQIRAALSATQQTKLGQLVGAKFNTAAIRGRFCGAPAFSEVAEWINTDPLTWEQLRGKVVVLHYWAFGCINCVRNLPHYQAWHEKLTDKGVTMIGLHTPETAAEKVADAVRAKVRENQMKYAIGIDAAAKNWNLWANRWWPSVYLVDQLGYVRSWWYGELNWQGGNGEEVMRKRIEDLLAERD